MKKIPNSDFKINKKGEIESPLGKQVKVSCIELVYNPNLWRAEVRFKDGKSTRMSVAVALAKTYLDKDIESEKELIIKNRHRKPTLADISLKPYYLMCDKQIKVTREGLYALVIDGVYVCKHHRKKELKKAIAVFDASNIKNKKELKKWARSWEPKPYELPNFKIGLTSESRVNNDNNTNGVEVVKLPKW